MAGFIDGRDWDMCHAQLTMLGHEEGSAGNNVVASLSADKALRASCRAPESWSLVMSLIASWISGGRTRSVDDDILDRYDIGIR